MVHLVDDIFRAMGRFVKEIKMVIRAMLTELDERKMPRPFLSIIITHSLHSLVTFWAEVYDR